MALITFFLLCGCLLLPVGIGLGVWSLLGWKFPMPPNQKLLRAALAGLAVTLVSAAFGTFVFGVVLRLQPAGSIIGDLPLSLQLLCVAGIALFVGVGASLSLWLRLNTLSPDLPAES